jgi:putative transcriptional regulator
MREENTVYVKLYPDGRLVEEMPDGTERLVEDTTDWERLRNMTEEEIIANALSDPDNPPLTDEELARMQRVVSARQIRKDLGMTQAQFAETFEIPLGTLRDWEQKGTFISHNQAAASYLRVIEQNPDAVISALAAYRRPRAEEAGGEEDRGIPLAS